MTEVLVRPDHRAGVTAPRPFGVLLLVLAALLVVNSVIGPLGAGWVDYPISGTLHHQLVGLEVVTIGLVVPWSVLAGVRALRGAPDAVLLAFAPAAYTVYMFIQYLLGPEYGSYHVVVLLHLAVITLSGGLTLWSWSLSRDAVLPVRSRRSERAYGALLLGLATFVVLRYAGTIVDSFGGAEIPGEFAAARTFYWSIYLLDLGVVVPSTVVAAVALLRGRDLGRRALFAVTGWFALVPPSVAAMAVTMLLNDDPNASAATVALLTVASVAFAALALAVYRAPRAAAGPDPRRPVDVR